jgi:hypothetical protein
LFFSSRIEGTKQLEDLESEACYQNSVKTRRGSSARVAHTLQVFLKIHIKPENEKSQMMNDVKTMN